MKEESRGTLCKFHKNANYAYIYNETFQTSEIL